jgi:hypothetical protein
MLDKENAQLWSYFSLCVHERLNKLATEIGKNKDDLSYASLRFSVD